MAGVCGSGHETPRIGIEREKSPAHVQAGQYEGAQGAVHACGDNDAPDRVGYKVFVQRLGAKGKPKLVQIAYAILRTGKAFDVNLHTQST